MQTKPPLMLAAMESCDEKPRWNAAMECRDEKLRWKAPPPGPLASRHSNGCHD